MKTSIRNMIVILATVASLLVVSAAMAKTNLNGNSGSGSSQGSGGTRPKPPVNSVNVANTKGQNLTTVQGNVGAGSNAINTLNGLGKDSNATTVLGSTDKGLSNAINTINNRGINVTTVLGNELNLNHGGNPPRGPEPKKPCHDGKCYNEHSCDYTWEGRSCEVFFGEYIVVPGDTFETISLKLYGTTGNLEFIAAFNRLPVNAALVPGQVLSVPSIETINVL